jgi:gag-polypeptide of LTR copia-type
MGITQDMSAQVMWTALTTKFETTSAATQTLAKDQIQQFKYTPSLPFEECFQQLEALRKAVSDVGYTITSDNLCSQFLTSLTPDYLWILQTHGAHPYAELKCVLIEYDMIVESALAAPGISSPPNALAAGSKSGSGFVHQLHFPASHTPSFAMNFLSLPLMDCKGYCRVWGNGHSLIRHVYIQSFDT